MNSLSCDFPKENEKSRKCQIKVFCEEVNGQKSYVTKDISKELKNEIAAVVGTPNNILAKQIVDSLVMASPSSKDSSKDYNIALQSFADSCPRDATEARLIAQAQASFTQGMEYLALAREVLFSQVVPAKDHWHSIYMKSATKCFEIHTKAIDTLNRYRQKGEQRVVVQHVTVQDGGKAVVGNVLPGGGGRN